jgi:hypothetical protein
VIRTLRPLAALAVAALIGAPSGSVAPSLRLAQIDGQKPITCLAIGR